MSQDISTPNTTKTNSGGARRIIYAVSLLAAFFLGTTFDLGKYTHLSSPSKNSITDLSHILRNPVQDHFTDTSIDFSQFWKVRQEIMDEYVHGPADEKKMFYGALSGMVAALGDPYSVYFDPDTAKDFEEQLNGKFEGIGAEIGIRDGRITVVAPLPDTPAERAGLRAKDVILKIDTFDTTDMTVEEAVSKIRGPSNTQVKLTVYRSGLKQPKEITITRSQIVMLSVRAKMLPGDIAYVELTQFNDQAAELFVTEVDKLLAKHPKGLVLDLRNNPGGLVNVAADILGSWIPDQVAVQERRRASDSQTYIAYGNGELRDMPTVVLVNGGSASASEILAGDLQDYGKAKIVGEQSFGKGTMQTLLDLDNGSQLKLTIAEWLTGKGRSIDKVGLTPDVVYARPESELETDADSQLDKAISVLRTLMK